MSAWPTNPYLDSFLRSHEGQAYLEKYGSLDAWRRRHLLDEGPKVRVVEIPGFFLMNPSAEVLISKDPDLDVWDF